MSFKKLLLTASLVGGLFLGGAILAAAAGCSQAYPVAVGGSGWCALKVSFIPFGNGTAPIATSSTLFFTTAANRLNFTYGSSTSQTISDTASTTNLIISSAGTGATKCLQVAADGTVSAASAACATGGGLSSYDAFTHQSFAGQTTSATTSTIWLTNLVGLAASSTIVNNATTTNATSTTLYVSGQLTNGASTGLAYETAGIFSALANGTNGQVHAMVNGTPGWVATTTFSSPLVYSSGAVTCPTCNTSAATVTSITNGGGLDFSVSPITTSGTITAQVGTSSVPTISQLAYWTGVGTPSTVGSVGTSSTSFSTGGFSTTGTIGAFVGGAASTIKQLQNRSFSYATTTWVGTTTINLESGYGELWNYAQCWTVPNGSTLNVDFYFRNNAAASHLDFINASSTAGRQIFTTNNTITNNASTSVDIGKPASTPTAITCTINDSI